MAVNLLSFENEVFSKFAFYAGVVLLKTIFVSLWTVRHRISKRVFVTAEDYSFMGGKCPPTFTTDQHIERIRRCHQNDLENVLPFVLIGLLYVLTEPDLYTATLLFRLFAGARLLHTLVYISAIPQPSRALCFAVNIFVNISMAVAVLRVAHY